MDDYAKEYIEELEYKVYLLEQKIQDLEILLEQYM